MKIVLYNNRKIIMMYNNAAPQKATESQLKLSKKFSSVMIIGPSLNDKLIDLIAHLFTPEEADVARHLPFILPKSYVPIARKAGQPQEEVKKMLETMNEKRVIFRMGDKYSIIPLIPGVFEYMFFKGRDDAWTREFARLLGELIDSGYFRRYTRFKFQLPTIHYVPINDPIETKNTIVDEDFMDKAVAFHDDIAIMNTCQCRHHHTLLGEECKYNGTSSDGCMWFGKFARWAVEDGSARSATKEEARAHMAQGKKKNLVFMTINASPESDLMVCLCCECCCHLLRVVNDFGGKSIVAQPQYIARVDDSLCNNCSSCAKVCHTRAHAFEDKKHGYDMENCVGCGVCVESCKTKAIQMTENSKYKKPPKSFNSLMLSLTPKALMTTIKTATYEKVLRK